MATRGGSGPTAWKRYNRIATFFITFSPESSCPEMKGTLPAVILVTGVMLTACKKRDFTAGRPTDIRIHNQTETALEEPIDDL